MTARVQQTFFREIDLNDAGTTVVLSLRHYVVEPSFARPGLDEMGFWPTTVMLETEHVAGTWTKPGGGAEFTVERSLDGSHWEDLSSALTINDEEINEVDCKNLPWLRVRLSTAEGSAGTARVVFNIITEVT